MRVFHIAAAPNVLVFEFSLYLFNPVPTSSMGYTLDTGMTAVLGGPDVAGVNRPDRKG